jgi:hypothetical protein
MDQPLYFAATDIPGKRAMRPGQLFEIQTKAYVRACGPAAGVPDAQTRPFDDLPHVRRLLVPLEVAQRAIEDGLTYDQARALLGADAPSAPPSKGKRAA